MESKTKSKVDRVSIEKICKKIYGQSTLVSEVQELTDGCYNASFLIHIDNEDKDVILKVAPSDDVAILSYEKDIMKTEVMLYQQVKEMTEIPIPVLIDINFARDIISVPYFVAERLYGMPLNKIEPISQEQRKIIYSQIAKYLAKLHHIKGDYFGYPNMNYPGVPYKIAFRNMVAEVLEDGKKKNAFFPMDYEAFFSLYDKYLDVLDEVMEPVLVHFDLWDGNVFVTDMSTSPSVEGLIDFERSFYGDRLADFVQVSFYIDLEIDHYFLDIYNMYSDEKIVYGQDERVRILLHKIYLFIIMIVESKYRDIEGSYNQQRDWASQELIKLVEQLRAIKL